jgi:hypothetical protein
MTTLFVPVIYEEYVRNILIFKHTKFSNFLQDFNATAWKA